MNNSIVMNFLVPSRSGKDNKAITRFREKFKRSLRHSVVRGFSVEESFGMVWMETLEEIPLNDLEQGEVYEDLIQWAKMSLLGFFPNHSQDLFTSRNSALTRSHIVGHRKP